MEIKETSLKNIEDLKRKEISFIIGISINNSYFKPENIKKLISWSSNFAKSIYIMIPDEPSVYTMMACGRSQEESIKISRLKSNNIENKCLRIISDLKVENITIIRWKNVKDNIFYLNAKKQIKNLYYLDVDFKNAIIQTTKNVILANVGSVVSESSIDLGVNFLFEELAFILYSTVILKEEKTIYVYHKTMQLMKDIIENKYNNLLFNSNIDFITAE